MSSDNSPQFSEDSFEVVQPGALEAMARADTNQQIATAKQFPRSPDLKKMQGRMIQMAAYSPEAAAECFYCIPRGGLDIYGPSVRLSEIAAYCWGNLYSVSRLVDINLLTRLVTAQAISWDLESNLKEGLEYTQRITIKGPEGTKAAALAALAMAKRNAKFAVIPRLIWWPVYLRCLEVARGDVVPLGDRINRMLKAFAVYGITLDRILAKFGYENVTQFTESDIPALIGYHTAIKEEASTPEEIFPKAGMGEMAEAATERRNSRTGQKENKGTLPDNSAAGAVPSGPASAAGPVPSGPAHESANPRRRGRPPGSGRKTASPTVARSDQGAAAQTPNVPSQPIAEGKLYGPEAGLPSIAQFPTQGADQAKAEPAKAPEREKDPQRELADKVRGLLDGSHKTEAALMAKLQEWGFSKNLPANPIKLEDYGANTLQQLIERWGQLSAHIKDSPTVSA